MDIHDQKPLGRQDGVLVEDLEDETLVYDLQTHEAHCLNPAAALVWRGCDGRTTVRALTRCLPEAGLPGDETLVWMALARLSDAGLVEPLEFPAGRGRFSRKEVLRVLGSAAALTLLLPAVDSVVAPLAAQAASCIANNDCVKRRPPDCTGLPICGNRTQCCKPSGTRCRALPC